RQGRKAQHGETRNQTIAAIPSSGYLRFLAGSRWDNLGRAGGLRVVPAANLVPAKGSSSRRVSWEGGQMVRARTKTDSLYWLPAQARALLDVGCNVGAFLGDCRSRFPNLALAGIDINEAALQVARERLPGVILHRAGAEQIPFPDQNFDYVT